MAFTNFYIQGGGNDANAGSSTANAADATSTNGSWDMTADTFIVAGAGVFSTVPVVGDWASIYVDGGTVAVYVSQVTAVGALGVSVTLSTTAKYGTKPSASATARSCKINGAWATELPLAASGLATTTVPASTKINIKGNLTITASRTISMAGTTTAPLWFSGYNTTPGDLDNDTTNALAKPVWTLNSSFFIGTSGVNQLWSGLSVVGSRVGVIWNATQNSFGMSRCRVENTSSNAGAHALAALGGMFRYSWFRAPTTATTTGTVLLGAATHFLGCVFEGGGLAGLNVVNASANIGLCVFLNNTGNGILTTTGGIQVWFCTIYNSTSDGIKWSSTPNVNLVPYVIGCLFNICGGYGINNASGANVNSVHRACNDFYSMTSGAENGFGDSPAFFGKTDASGVVTSSTDMTPVTGSAAWNNGFPGTFENGGALVNNVNYTDIGAIRHADPTTGGAPYIIGG